jgi:hypothetical protein
MCAASGIGSAALSAPLARSSFVEWLLLDWSPRAALPRSLTRLRRASFGEEAAYKQFIDSHLAD